MLLLLGNPKAKKCRKLPISLKNNLPEAANLHLEIISRQAFDTATHLDKSKLSTLFGSTLGVEWVSKRVKNCLLR